MRVGLVALSQIIQKEEQNLIRAYTPAAMHQTTNLNHLVEAGPWYCKEFTSVVCNL
jgi:hypothetical protein